MYNHETRTITTERLILRPFQLTDAKRVFELCNNYNVYKSTLTLPYPYSLECAKSWIETHEDHFKHNRSYEFAISDKYTGELYGAIGLKNNQLHKNGEIGYWIGVFARHFASNPGSGRVMQKCGMQKEGVLQDHIYKENKFVDLILYGIVNSAETI